MMGRLHVFKLSSNFQIDATHQSGATISRHFLIMSLLVVPAGCTPITYQQLGRVLSEANHENNDAAALCWNRRWIALSTSIDPGI